MFPLCIDLFCGLGGWSEGFLAEGYTCFGFDIERHDYGSGGYPGHLVIQDVRTLHGSQFKDATVIVASPPCQKYSYMAMPWSRAKKLRQDYLSGERSLDDLNGLFNACFRIQQEASEAAGRYIPLIVENVRGAAEWVGPANWNYGSFYLWGDIPALMPIPSLTACKLPGAHVNWHDFGKEGYKSVGWNHTAEQRFRDDRKNNGGSWFNIAHNTTSGCGNNPDGRKSPGLSTEERDGKTGLAAVGFNVRNAQLYRDGTKIPGNNGPRLWQEREIKRWGDALKGVPHEPIGHWTNPNENGGIKMGGGWWHDTTNNIVRRCSSKSDSRKAAAAHIARIPFALARHIARVYKPDSCEFTKLY